MFLSEKIGDAGYLLGLHLFGHQLRDFPSVNKLGFPCLPLNNQRIPAELNQCSLFEIRGSSDRCLDEEKMSMWAIYRTALALGSIPLRSLDRSAGFRNERTTSVHYVFLGRVCFLEESVRIQQTSHFFLHTESSFGSTMKLIPEKTYPSPCLQKRKKAKIVT